MDFKKNWKINIEEQRRVNYFIIQIRHIYKGLPVLSRKQLGVDMMLLLHPDGLGITGILISSKYRPGAHRVAGVCGVEDGLDVVGVLVPAAPWNGAKGISPRGPASAWPPSLRLVRMFNRSRNPHPAMQRRSTAIVE